MVIFYERLEYSYKIYILFYTLCKLLQFILTLFLINIKYLIKKNLMLYSEEMRMRHFKIEQIFRI